MFVIKINFYRNKLVWIWYIGTAIKWKVVLPAFERVIKSKYVWHYLERTIRDKKMQLEN